MSRLAAIVYSANNPRFTEVALDYVTRTVDPSITETVCVDNGSDVPFPKEWANRTIRYATNVGGNALFHRALTDNWWKEGQEPEFLAFFHCDFFVHEIGWDRRVLEAFDADPKLNLIGFVGSWEIDSRGGRGGGTMLNYLGLPIKDIGQGSHGELHGGKIIGLRAAAVVDHCVMIFRRSALEFLTPQEGHFAPEHFYDRILSCEVIEKGGRVAVLGIGCDHFSGGIGPGHPSADALRKKWLEEEGIPYTDSYTAVYIESERRFFQRFTGFFPFWVNEDYSIGRL